MSKLSIYESRWIDLVFEDKNKNYGAYQLRQESTKNTVSAFFLGILLITTIVCIAVVANKVSPNTLAIPEIPEFVVRPIDLDKIIPVTPEEPVKKTAPPTVKNPVENVVTTQQMTNPQVVNADVATPDVPKNSEFSQSSTTTAVSGDATTGTVTTATQGTTPEVELPNNSIVNTTILDKSPEFPGGMKKFYSYIGNNFAKPDIEGIETIRISVAFVIEKDGSLTDIRILKDPGYGLGQEAIRVLKSLKTKWSPGILNGKPMRTAYTLPIVIKAE
ncbi:energy transducer TonB [Flavobacterium sp. TSSA_36]|uniref:energy transducer TonB n=1 Tax=Flavobacterium sp. TSSA_36 TaxID=3447669 RepID=UPI003F2AD6AE